AHEVARARGVAGRHPRQRRLAGPDRYASAARRDAGAAGDRGLADAVRAPWPAVRDRRRVRLPALTALHLRHRNGGPGEWGLAAVKAAPAPVMRQAPFGEALVRLGARRPDVVV